MLSFHFRTTFTIMFLFLLSILSLSTTTTAFAPQQKTHYYQQQQNQYDLLSILTNDRIYSSSLLKAKTNDKDSFDLDSLISHITDDDDDDDYDDEPIQLMAELIRPLLSSDDAIEYGADNQDATKIETGNQIAYEMAKGRFVDLCSQLEGEEKLESLFLHAAETEIGRTVLENDNHDDDDDENLVQYRRIVEGAIESMPWYDVRFNDESTWCWSSSESHEGGRQSSRYD
jgi:hypothetical protein